jgi:hypothetical protein
MPSKHHASDTVHKLFLTGAIITLLASPFFNAHPPQQPTSFMVAIILLSIMAGFTSPKGIWRVVTKILEIAVSLFSIIFFENFSLMFVNSPLGLPFLANQLVALIFIVATYLNAKTLGEVLQ